MIVLISKKIKKALDKNNPIIMFCKWIVYIIITFTLFTLLFKISENVSFMEAFWQGWQTITTVGYGNNPANTPIGRMVTMVFGTVGIALIGMILSTVFDLKFHYHQKRRLGLMDNTMKNGYVLFNYIGEQKVFEFIKEIRELEEDIPVCIVDNRLESLPEVLQTLPSVHFVKGSNLDQQTYKKANIKESKGIIVFPTDPNSSESDGGTKTTVDLVSDFVDESTKIMHVLVDKRNAWMFNKTRSVQVYDSIEMLILVQECVDDYSSDIVEELLLNSKGANPQSVKPSLIVGITWGEFCKKAIEISSTSEILCNPFTLVKDGKTNTCPMYTDIIEKNDTISVIAYNDFCWNKFEKKIKKSLT